MKDHQWIPSRGQRLSAMVHLPDQGKVKDPVIVMCHGFTGDKIGMNQMNARLAAALESAGYAVIRFDFLGSGDSDGEFATDTIVAGWLTDTANVMQWVSEQPEFSSLPIVLYGHSLGGLIALCHKDEGARVAARIAFAPVVDAVENLRTSILGQDLWQKSFRGETIANFYGKAYSLRSQFVHDLAENRYDPLHDAAVLTTPLLIVHGTSDVAVPIEGSHILFERYNGPKEMKVLEIDHVAAGQLGPWIAAIIEWLDRTFPDRRMRAI